MAKHQKQVNTEFLGKYSKQGWTKPRRMKPRSMTDKAVRAFNQGHEGSSHRPATRRK